MKYVQGFAASLAVVAGLAIVLSSLPAERSVASDFLMRSETVPAEATKVEAVEETLSDWESTGRGRPAKCRRV